MLDHVDVQKHGTQGESQLQDTLNYWPIALTSQLRKRVVVEELNHSHSANDFLFFLLITPTSVLSFSLPASKSLPVFTNGECLKLPAGSQLAIEANYMEDSVFETL